MQKNARTEKCLSALSYLPFLVLISLFLERKRISSDLLRFHVNQGLVLFIVECCLLLPLAILSQLLKAYWAPIGTVIYILIFLLALVFLFLSIRGIVFSSRAQMREIPIFNRCTPFQK